MPRYKSRPIVQVRLRGLVAEASAVEVELADGQVVGRVGSDAVAVDLADALAEAAGNTEDTAVMIGDQALTTSYADLPSLSFEVVANKHYRFRFEMVATADAVGTGIDLAVNGPSGEVLIAYSQLYPSAVNAMWFKAAGAYDVDTANTGSGGTTPTRYVCEGSLVTGASGGTLTARAKYEAAGVSATAKAGSCAFLWTLS